MAGSSGLSRDRPAVAGLPLVSAAGWQIRWPGCVLHLRFVTQQASPGLFSQQPSKVPRAQNQARLLRPGFRTSTLSPLPPSVGLSKPQSQSRFKEGKRIPPLDGRTCKAPSRGAGWREGYRRFCSLPEAADETCLGRARKEPAVCWAWQVHK